MPSSSPDFTRIYTKFNDINARQTIPAANIPILEQRLVIVCMVPQTQQRRPRRSKRLENREYLVQSRERKAREIYSEVLDELPDIFLPFILVVSPKACCQFNVGRFFQQHTKQPITLCNDANLMLWRIATTHGIEKTVRFQKLMSSLFNLPSPATDIEGERSWSLNISDFAAIRTCLGNTICDAVECSPAHKSKPVGCPSSETSECVKMKVPYDADRDAVVYIEVGSALELADMLFAAASERIAAVLPKFSQIALQSSDRSETALDSTKQASSGALELDFAYLTLRGASVSAIGLLFGTSILEGIDESELRSWEKDQLLLDATDCVTMQLRRAQPEYGRIRLRIGFWAGVNLVNKLYPTSSSAAIT